MERAIEARDQQMSSLLVLILRILFGLWRRPGVVSDPLLVAATKAATLYELDVAMARARAIESSYFTSIAREEFGVEYTPEDRQTDFIYPRNADPLEVYDRVIEEFRWHAYGRPDDDEQFTFEGLWDALGPETAEKVIEDWQTTDDEDTGLVLESEEQALRIEYAYQQMERRAGALVDGDIQRAAGDESGQLMGKKGVWIGYRRVIRPERSRTGTCGLCIAASTRVYQVKELAPIHANCKCTSVPMTSDMDPADTLNRSDIEDILTEDEEGNVRVLQFGRQELDDLYEAAGDSTAAAALKRVRVFLTTHGELGPVLSRTEPGTDRLSEWRETGLNQTQRHWENTRVWAEAKKALVEAAIQRGETGPRTAPYAQAIRQFDSLIARMEENLRNRRR